MAHPHDTDGRPRLPRLRAWWLDPRPRRLDADVHRPERAVVRSGRIRGALGAPARRAAFRPGRHDARRPRAGQRVDRARTAGRGPGRRWVRASRSGAGPRRRLAFAGSTPARAAPLRPAVPRNSNGSAVARGPSCRRWGWCITTPTPTRRCTGSGSGRCRNCSAQTRRDSSAYAGWLRGRPPGRVISRDMICR